MTSLKVICIHNRFFTILISLYSYIDTYLFKIGFIAGRKAKCPGELWPTLIAVSYLTLGLPQFHDSWALVVEKANNWLGTQQFVETKLKKKAAKFVKEKLKL